MMAIYILGYISKGISVLYKKLQSFHFGWGLRVNYNATIWEELCLTEFSKLKFGFRDLRKQ